MAYVSDIPLRKNIQSASSTASWFERLLAGSACAASFAFVLAVVLAV